MTTTTRRRRRPLGRPLVAAVALLGACTSTPAPSPEPAPEPSPPAAESPEPAPPEATPDPPTPDDQPDEDPPEPESDDSDAPELIAVVDVRTGEHEGYDRVVFELSGPATGWTVEYGEAVRQGSGEVAEVDGEATLRVAIEGIGYPDDLPDGVTPWPPTDVDGPGASVVTVVHDAVFEGHHTFFVGTRGELPFFTSQLEEPDRLVIDVLHPMS